MVAYHFPPLAGSSGIQRTLRFAQHLPAFGWQSLVLTAHRRAYEQVNSELELEIPNECVVRRAFALDAARHISLAGRYIGATARPDRWVSWKFGAVCEGMRMIREFRPQVLWSTYPIATAHLIGAELARRSGLPWIADFRDPMAQDGYPADPITRRQFRAIELSAMRTSQLNTFTTPGAVRMYRGRYPDAAARIELLENGYDEEAFIAAATNCPAEKLNPGIITLLHSGIVYPSERDPTQLLVALGQLKREGRLPEAPFKLRFRAPVHENLLHDLAAKHDAHDLIEVLPPISYKAALQEMLRADGLVVMQGSGCNEQIPAKVYEYLRARRPVIGLCDPRGDTAGLLRQAGIAPIVSLASAEEIALALPVFVMDVHSLRANLPDLRAIDRASRYKRAEELARYMDRLAE